MLSAYDYDLGYKMNLKDNFLYSHQAYSEEQRERFHQVVRDIEGCYQE